MKEKIIKILEKNNYEKISQSHIPEVRKKVWKSLKKKNTDISEYEYVKEFNNILIEIDAKKYSFIGVRLNGKIVKAPKEKRKK